MNIGEFRDRVTLQYVSSTDETVVDLLTVWAKVKPMSGARLLTYEQLHIGQWYDIWIQEILSVTYVAGDPIKYGVYVLTVHSVTTDELSGIVHIRAYSTGTASASATPESNDLLLTWDAIANVPVPNPASAYDWNWYFGLPTNGTGFVLAEVAGNVVNLIRGGSIVLKASLFANNTHLVSFVDTQSRVIACNSLCFSGCTSCTVYRLPGVLTMGTTIWNGISGKTIAITVKTALSANANVAALESANTVTKTLV